MMTKTFKITIGILILLALIAGGVFSVSKNSSKGQVTSDKEEKKRINKETGRQEGGGEAKEQSDDTIWRKLDGVFVYYTLEYPNGWHVVDDHGVTKEGYIRTSVIFNPIPITTIGRGGQGGVIVVHDESQDPNNKNAPLRSFNDFLNEDRKEFRDLKEETFDSIDGIKIYKLSGKTEQYNSRDIEVRYYLEYIDKINNYRHNLYVTLEYQISKDEEILSIVDHMLKTFAVRNASND